MKNIVITTSVILASITGAAIAESYPSKPISFLVSLPGGAPEGIQRAIFDKVRENTGATLLFDARPGGGGAVGLNSVKSAAPDGYTYSLTFASSVNLNPLVNKDIGIDPLKDFVPVTQIMSLGVVIAVRDDFAAKDIRDLVTMAKAKPNTVKIGLIGAGNRSWVAMLEERTGAKFLQVPYKSSADMVIATLGGQVDAYFDTVGTMMAQKGKLRALSFGGASPAPQIPGVPLVRDLYKFDMQSWFGILAKSGTPPAAINWVSREIARALKEPKIIQMIESNGLTPVGNTPEEFMKELKTELELNTEVIRKYPEIR